MLALAARHLAPANDALWSAIERRGAEMARAPVKHQQQQQQEEQQEQGGGVSGGGGGLSWFEASWLAWAASKAGHRAAVLTPALAEWVVEASSAASERRRTARRGS